MLRPVLKERKEMPWLWWSTGVSAPVVLSVNHVSVDPLERAWREETGRFLESNGDAFVEGDGPEGGRLVDEVAGGRGAVAESVLVLVAVEGVVETKVVEDALALPSPEEAVGEIFLASIAHGN